MSRPISNHANIIPFAVVCAGWIVPVIRFWLLAWGVYRPAGEASAPPAMMWFVAIAAFCLALWYVPASYYRIRAFEGAGRLHELLGVRLFRSVAPNGDLANRWQRRADPAFRVIASRSDAREFRAQTIRSERAHLPVLAIGVASAAYAARIGWTGWAIYLSLATVIVHLYPILLQRYTRARIERVLRTED